AALQQAPVPDVLLALFQAQLARLLACNGALSGPRLCPAGGPRARAVVRHQPSLFVPLVFVARPTAARTLPEDASQRIWEPTKRSLTQPSQSNRPQVIRKRGAVP